MAPLRQTIRISEKYSWTSARISSDVYDYRGFRMMLCCETRTRHCRGGFSHSPWMQVTINVCVYILNAHQSSISILHGHISILSSHQINSRNSVLASYLKESLQAIHPTNNQPPPTLRDMPEELFGNWLVYKEEDNNTCVNLRRPNYQRRLA